MAAPVRQAGRPLGKLVGGAVAGLVWATILLLGLVECGLQMSGFLGAVHGILSHGSRRLQVSQDEWPMIDLLVRAVVFLLISIVELTALYFHWRLYIRPTPDKYIPRRAIVPEDLKGSFKYGLFDCAGDLGTCCCFIWFTPCMFADYWYRAGWIHVLMSDTQVKFNCPGWQFFAGVLGFLFLECSAECCMPVAFAVLRGGVPFGDGSDVLDGVVPHRQRFGIPNKDVFLSDCCTWCWCGPCAGVQEYRQVMDLLNRGPVQEEQCAVGNLIVGAPIQVGTVVGTVETPTNDVEKNVNQ